MSRKIPLLFVFFALATAVFAQEDFWISLNGEGAMYGVEGLAFGGGLSLGYGSGTSFGLKAVWYFGTDKVNTLELNIILRFYLQGAQAYSGPFLQFMGGPTLYSLYEEGLSIPSKFGMISAGLCFGWRFIFVDRWFVEPSVRGGYPYLFGAGVSAGVRF